MIKILIVVLAFNLAVFSTYPINVGLYDYSNYLKMIMEGSSFLVHASGYPAALHLLFDLLSITPTGGQYLTDTDWLLTIQKFQLGIHLILYLVALWLCYKSYGSLVTLLFSFGWGTCIVFANAVNTAGPEWLQGHGIILSLLLSAYAGTLDGYRKALAYTFSAAVFAGAYLVKYNSLLLAPALLGFILFERKGWFFKVSQIIASTLIFSVVVHIYASEYHYKTAGTKQLTFDHAWILTDSLPANYLTKNPETMGINTLRYVSLVRITPTDWSKLDWGNPGDFLEGYKDKYDNLMVLDRNDLISIAKQTPLPPGVTANNSSLPLYNYYGKARADRLGILVYFEALRDHPDYYLKRVTSGLWKTFREIPYGVTFPIYSEPLGASFGAPDFVAGTIKLFPPKDLGSPYYAPYYNPTEILSFWGVKFMDMFNAIKSSSLIYFIFNLIAVIGLLTAVNLRTKLNGVILTGGLLCYVLASYMIIGIRFKEAVAIVPVYFLISSLGISNAFQFARTSIAKWKRSAL
ncbi:Uncharacterized protein ToN1_30240 [Aromatoleum petrolei]|nr:Uncharacterized protein ToN1_30240 [Aromatoleum petrolei]